MPIASKIGLTLRFLEEQAEPVERVTVAGNFYQLLKAVRAVGSDLEFPGSSIGCPSLDVGTLTVSGK